MQQKRRRAKHTATVENVTVALTDVVTGEYFISQLSSEFEAALGNSPFSSGSVHTENPPSSTRDRRERHSTTLLGFIAKRVTSCTRTHFISHNPVSKMHLFKLPKLRRCISIGTATALQSQSDTEHKAPRGTQTHTKSKIMSDQVLSEVGKRGGGGRGGYTSLFTGHFLWLSLGGIIRQTNSSQRLGDVTQDPKKRKKKKSLTCHVFI